MNIQKTPGQVAPAIQSGSRVSSRKRTASDAQFSGLGVSTNDSSGSIDGLRTTKKARHYTNDDHMSSMSECDRQAIKKILDEDKYGGTSVQNTSTTGNIESTVTTPNKSDKNNIPAEFAEYDTVMAELLNNSGAIEWCIMNRSCYGEEGSILDELIDAYVAKYGAYIKPYCESAINYMEDVYKDRHYKPWKGGVSIRLRLIKHAGVFLDKLVKSHVHRAQNPTAVDNIASFAGSTVVATSNAVCSIASSVGWLFRR
ncbi:MAG: hypothetical protein QS748_01945 [Candidatus Endonucleobacter bathymodioli]|uniref:Uncharacterized protein n=1 Tax=Candidatus Endonucleibacter bathymodioli TaxID=539814 RepID=A0AA90NK26_9GAMM|nr:hypothetical protein [Candidatus Endonucleobacter bathymodioli]